MLIHHRSIYWTVTGTSELWKVEVDECGHVAPSVQPALIASNVTCDDLLVDPRGDIFVASPKSVITKVTPDGAEQVIAGTFGSSNSSLVGPTAMRFGRVASDRWSLYVTTNGGIPQIIGKSVPSAAGVSRIDLG